MHPWYSLQCDNVSTNANKNLEVCIIDANRNKFPYRETDDDRWELIFEAEVDSLEDLKYQVPWLFL